MLLENNQDLQWGIHAAFLLGIVFFLNPWVWEVVAGKDTGLLAFCMPDRGAIPGSSELATGETDNMSYISKP